MPKGLLSSILSFPASYTPLFAFGVRPITSLPQSNSPGRADDDRLTPLREMQLVEAAQNGEADALCDLLRSYQRRIYAVCYRMVRDPDRASDLTQDCLVKVMDGLGSYDGRSAFSTWVIRVAMNCCLSYLRKEKLRRHASLDPGMPLSEPVEQGELSGRRRVERDEEHDLLVDALDSLDDQMRAILILRDMQGLDYQQIGLVLDIPVGTVKSRLFRARTALREALERRMDPPKD